MSTRWLETTEWRRGSSRLLLACILWVWSVNGAEPPQEPLRVMIMHGTHMLLPGSLIQEKAVREVMIAGSPRPIEFFSESCDANSVNGSDYESQYVALLQAKFRRQKPDLIMAAQLPAFGFISRCRDELWPDVPVVVFGLGNLGPNPRLPRGVTAVSVRPDPVGTVQLALRLQPDVRRICVVGGVADLDRGWIPLLNTELRPFEERMAIIYLTNQSIREIQEEVRRLPRDSMVLYTTIFRDAAGRAAVPRDACFEVAKASAVPVYGLYDSLIGYGIVGGSMGTIESNARRAAEIALRVLAGEKPEDIPAQAWPPPVPVVDMHQLKRWGISESRVPPGSTAYFRQPGYWERHRGLIIGAAALALAQFVLIVALWINWAKRRRSERVLDAQLRFERLVSELSAMFINLPLESVDGEVMKALEKVRAAMDLDHCHLFTLPAGSKTLEIAHHAESPGIKPLGPRLDGSSLRWLFSRLRDRRIVSLENVLDDLPAAAVGERAFAMQNNLQSMLMIPMRQGRESVQGVCYQTTRRLQQWPEALASRLHLIGEILISTLAEKQAELAVLQNEARYRAIVEDQTELICRILPDGTATFVNDAYCAYFNRSREDMVGRSVWELIPPEGHESVRVFLATITPDHPVGSYEQAMREADGTVRWLQWRGRGFFDEQGGIIEFQAVGRDITDRKEAEVKLRASEERYRAVVESQTDMVARFLPDTTLTFVNEAYCRYFGRTREELIGQKFLNMIPEGSWEQVLEHIGAVGRSRATATHEHEVRLSDGRVGWHQWINYAVVGPDGTVTEFQGIGRDISDRKRAEDASRTLAQASRLALMGELTATIGHEINQPLTAIVSNAKAGQMLLDAKSPALSEVRHILADIRDDGLRAGNVIRHIRSLLQQREAEMKLLDLNEVVGDVLRFIEADALQRGVKLQTRFAQRLPGVRGDRVHLQQALLNLVMNGMDSMNETPEAERQLIVSTSLAGGTVQLSVSDRGHGIPLDRLVRVFDSFFTTKKDGMGLGLSIARSIVHAHEGKIWGEKNPAGGMTFRFELPFHKDGSREDSARQKTARL